MLLRGLCGDAVADHCAEQRGSTDTVDDVLLLGDLLDDGVLPGHDLGGGGLREPDGVAGDVADEVRVLMRQVVLHGDDLVAPVLGHQVDVELLGGVQGGQPAEERRDVLVGAAPEELEGQVEPEPLASMVGVLLSAAVGLARVEPLVEFPVPDVVDALGYGDDQVEVVVGTREGVRVGCLAELLQEVADERAELLGSGAEQVDVLGFRAEAECASDELQGGPEVHGGCPSEFPVSSQALGLMYLLCLRYKMRLWNSCIGVP